MKTCGYRHGKAPYGFMKVPRGMVSLQDLVENPEEQAVPRRIKSWVDAGLPIPEIAARLNAQGVRPHARSGGAAASCI